MMRPILTLMFALAIILFDPAPVQAEGDRAAAAFDQLKTLVGEWRVADRPDSAFRINFSLTAAGTVLVERWQRAEGQTHSLTLYHRDGDTLMATHYCPQGNQPRMVLAPADPAHADTIRFDFHDATDLDPASEEVQHNLSFHFLGESRLERSEIYRNGDADIPGSLNLVKLE